MVLVFLKLYLAIIDSHYYNVKQEELDENVFNNNHYYYLFYKIHKKLKIN